jgi:hypothetical protein
LLSLTAGILTAAAAMHLYNVGARVPGTTEVGDPVTSFGQCWHTRRGGHPTQLRASP